MRHHGPAQVTAEHRGPKTETGRPTAIRFGSLRLLVHERALLDGAEAVSLGARAMDVLLALVQFPGEVVGKEDLARRVWGNSAVDDSNLRVHVAALRKALRDGEEGRRFIVTVPGRGYSFVAPVEPVGDDTAPRSPRPDIPASARLGRIIGRDEVLTALDAALTARRFVTLVGPGGIGKTSVALEVARTQARRYPDGVSVIDFSTVDNERLVPSVVSSVFGLVAPGEDAMPAIVSYLRPRRMLLVLDCCEHVIEMLARLAEEIIAAAPEIHILATSREPLRAAGEAVHRLQPLAGPDPSPTLTASEATSFPGIRLLVERAASQLGGFALSDADAGHAAEICRRLDGIPLAIELAAARLPAFGMAELVRRLDDRFHLLTTGRRTALPRHQTLRATLDWSYDLLDEASRRFLRHLAIFRGEFTLAATEAMHASTLCEYPVGELADLVSKSLVIGDFGGRPSRYRLLESTRLYALERLEEAGETEAARDCHAAFMVELFRNGETDGESLRHEDWIRTYGSQIDNLRAALDWCSRSPRTAELYVALATVAVPLWVQFSLMAECREHVERALALLRAAEPTPENRRREMRLSAARGWSLMYAAGRSEATKEAWARTRDLAEELDDPGYRLRGLWGFWIGTLNEGDWRTALGLARQLSDIARASGDARDAMMADRIMATTLHYRGDQDGAHSHMLRMLDTYHAMGRHPRVARFQVDQRIAAHYFLARIEWLRGRFGQAQVLVDRNVAEGLEVDHALTFCSVLGQAAGPLALLGGDVGRAKRFGAMLRDHAERYRLNLWTDWAVCFEALAAASDGDPSGIATMDAVLNRVGDNRFLPRYIFLLGEMAGCLGRLGIPGRGLSIIHPLIERCEATEERWYLPEALRIQAALTRRMEIPNAGSRARETLRHAASLAREQGALGWLLRIVTDLTEASDDDAWGSELREVLDSVDGGFETADVRRARTLLSGSRMG